MIGVRQVADPIAVAYDAAAEHYDSWHWSAYWQAHEVPVITALLDQEQRGLLVDAGCGTGRYRALARTLGFAYLGLDISSRMLAVAASRFGPSCIGDGLLEADVRETGIPAQVAGVTLCTRTLCHLPDLDVAFGEFARITAQHGSLILADLHPTFRVPLTRLPTAAGKIEVRTFRRTPENLVNAARRFGFQLADRFDLGSSASEAFFVLRLRREA